MCHEAVAETVSTLFPLLIWIKACRKWSFCWRVTFILGVLNFKLRVKKSKTAFFLCKPQSQGHLLSLCPGPDQPWAVPKSAVPMITKVMMMSMLWEAGQQPGPVRWLLWWPSPQGGVEPLWHWGDSGNGRGRSPGSNSTSKSSAGPSAGPVVHSWLTWRPGTTPSWPRPLGCPRWFVRRHAPPEEGV